MPFNLRFTWWMLLVGSLLLIGNKAFASQVLFSSSEEIPALRLKYSQLEEILTKASQLATDANRQFSQSSNFVDYLQANFGNEWINEKGNFIERQRSNIWSRFPEEEISFVSGGDTETLVTHEFQKNNSLPDESYEVTYTYSFRSDAFPVTSIKVLLGDYRRQIEIRGNSLQNVEAIKNNLKADLLKHSTILGGMSFRSGALLVVLISISFLFMFTVINIIEGKPKSWILAILCGFAIYSLFVLPFKHWFPGAAIYREDPSFIVYYGPEIGFGGFILGIVALVVPWFQDMAKRSKVDLRKKQHNDKKLE